MLSYISLCLCYRCHLLSDLGSFGLVGCRMTCYCLFAFGMLATAWSFMMCRCLAWKLSNVKREMMILRCFLGSGLKKLSFCQANHRCLRAESKTVEQPLTIQCTSFSRSFLFEIEFFDNLHWVNSLPAWICLILLSEFLWTEPWFWAFMISLPIYYHRELYLEPGKPYHLLWG